MKIKIGERELKPCPFCGESSAELRKWQILDAKRPTYYVLCRHCYVETNATGAVVKQIAIDRWNTRALNSREWIPVSELPEENLNVWLTIEVGGKFEVAEGYLDMAKGWRLRYDIGENSRVCAWMPILTPSLFLPDAPAETDL